MTHAMTHPSADRTAPEADPAGESDPSTTDLRHRLSDAFEDLRGGDVDALDRLWELSADRLYGLALWRCGHASEAADAVQETWIRLARAAGEGRLPQVRDPLAYLLTVTRRCAVDQLRTRRDHDDLDDLDADIGGESSLLVPTSRSESKIDARRAEQALRHLPDEQREAVYLRLFAGLSFREIGEATDSPQFTAASRYRLGLRKLRDLLSPGRATAESRGKP